MMRLPISQSAPSVVAMTNVRFPTPLLAALMRIAAVLAGCTIALPARAAFLSGETLDTAADYVALFVLFFVPIGLIVLFWLVHVMPEKIAEKRHHPQKDAIHTLCLLSLVFGGLLWPIAWLWAYTKPVGYKLAYGTEKHDDYYIEMAEKAKAGDLSPQEVASLRDELDMIDARGQLSPKLKSVRDELAASHAPAIAAKRADAPPVLSEAVVARKAGS